jgi:large subunit ribosomal protein L23
VASQATKKEISKAVETRYNVKPIKVNVINNLGKAKRLGRIRGKQKDWRKAIITLPKGKSINVYEAKSK